METSFEIILAAAMAVFVLGYLIYTLIYPEKF